MRAAAILGPGNVSKHVAAFQRATAAQWTSLIEQANAVVIFGGDGTIHHQLATLVDLDVPVLAVPCGSGNDFARALGLRSVRDAITAWKNFAAGEGNVRTIDLGIISRAQTQALKLTLVNRFQGGAESADLPRQNGDRLSTDESAALTGYYFCCVAGVGIDTLIAARANRLPRWVRSRGGYFLSAPPEFLRFAPFPMSISSNGTRAAAFRPTVLAAVANAPAYGGGMKIAPGAKLDDGMLDLCVVGGMDVWKLFCLFPTVYFGRHLGFSEVQYSQVPAVRIETEYPLEVYADGEFVCTTPVEFGVARNALKVIVAGNEQ